MSTTTPEEEFGDLAEFLAPEPKTLTIRGKAYDFPADVSARTWLVLQHVLQAGVAAQAAAQEGREYNPRALVLDDDAEIDVRGELFGDCADDLIDDDVPGSFQQHAMTTLMVWHVYGRAAALATWRRQGEAEAPNRAARRAKPRASAGSGTTTKTPASSSGTRSTKASSRTRTR